MARGRSTARLLAAGVEIHEYAASFLHAKVAVVDAHWATVGSSNLDPLSLLLAREANVVVRDRDFAQRLARAAGTGHDAGRAPGRRAGVRQPFLAPACFWSSWRTARCAWVCCWSGAAIDAIALPRRVSGGLQASRMRRAIAGRMGRC